MNQLDFFSHIENKVQPRSLPQASKIQGLIYIPDYLNPSEHDELLFHLDYDGAWSDELKRRVQHYGYKYNYIAKSIDTSMRIGKLPDWCLRMAERLHSEKLVDVLPDQIIVNEYNPGQGIGKHIDCVPCFEETIASLSLISDCVMNFTHCRTNERINILLKARSLLIFKGDARYMWYHAIAPRKVDNIEGISFERKRRVSMTFRKVKLSKTITNEETR